MSCQCQCVAFGRFVRDRNRGRVQVRSRRLPQSQKIQGEILTNSHPSNFQALHNFYLLMQIKYTACTHIIK